MVAVILGLPEKEWFASGHSACSGCGMAISFRHILKAAGENTIVVMGTGCGEVVSTAYPLTSWKHAAIHNAFENTASTASGIESALKMLGKKTKILIISGDGGCFDIGFGALSGMLERGHNICYVCYDNGAYANTGVQRSGATPKYANTTTTPVGDLVKGKVQWGKPLPFIVAAHKIPYVATANPAYPLDLYNKVKKGLETKGPAYVQVFSVCVPGWGTDTSKTIEISKLSFETCFYPLFEIVDGKLNLKKVNNKKPLEDFFKLQSRFKHLLKPENKNLFEEVKEKVSVGWRELLSNNGQKIC
ncbi:MAG: hypothetical protein KKG60_03360 [Nanoarchaeota archaeon]|nr:hypothetical protein [Nanoarchaeota archaeon]